eukprot:EC823221.1.p1 GENE.EC823221.1~~EC823221.1.p1  ORF type:complete len:73 (+),score=31.52 EC823221.1:284-502(+)
MDAARDWFNLKKEKKEKKGKIKESSDFLFRRRTRHVTVIHEVPTYIPEGEYKLTFVSNGETPQIIAVVSDRL